MKEQLKDKKRHIIFIVLFSFLILGITIADFITSDRYFSENENRILASKPTATIHSVLDSTFSKEYEDYVTDQFIARDFWIQLKNYTEIALQKKELNGVYLANDGSLIEKHSAADMDSKKLVEKQLKLAEQTNIYADILGTDHVKVMLVPTANMILTDKLPKYTEEFQQFDYLDDIRKSLIDPQMLLPVGEELQKHSQEYIYYKTDHHWTTLGAYYAYLIWADSLGITPLPEFGIGTVSNHFLGTLHSKINIKVPYDTIDTMQPLNHTQNKYQINYLYENQTKDSFYDIEKLKTKDQYGVFLGGNFPLVEIKNIAAESAETNQNLLIIKDSYANCFAPFAANHFTKVYLLDPRYYRDNILKVIKQYDITDILILYDGIHFIENY